MQPGSLRKDFQLSWWLNSVGVCLLFHLLASYTYCLWVLDGQNYSGAGWDMPSVWIDFVTEMIVLGWAGLPSPEWWPSWDCVTSGHVQDKDWAGWSLYFSLNSDSRYILFLHLLNKGLVRAGPAVYLGYWYKETVLILLPGWSQLIIGWVSCPGSHQEGRMRLKCHDGGEQMPARAVWSTSSNLVSDIQLGFR